MIISPAQPPQPAAQAQAPPLPAPPVGALTGASSASSSATAAETVPNGAATVVRWTAATDGDVMVTATTWAQLPAGPSVQSSDPPGPSLAFAASEPNTIFRGREFWLHTYAKGYVRPSVRPPGTDGEIFDQLPDSLPPMPAHYQPAAPASAAAESTDTGGPCPGVTVAEVLAPSASGGPGGHVYAKDVLPPMLGSWSWADSTTAVDDPTTRCARYLTDAHGLLSMLRAVR